MEALISYLIRSTIWLTVFGLIYFLVLRNERFFVLNRLFLITGLLAAIIFPLITIRYSVTIPFTPSPVTTGPVTMEAVQTSQNQEMPWKFYLAGVMVLGTLFFLFKTMIQTLKVYKTISSSEVNYQNNLKVVKSGRFRHSFSFFSYIIVNPSSTEKEYKEIVAHEAAHIRQYHWIDLVLSELLRTIQWFNPMAWLYSHYIRQNHEYLADRSALKATSDPAVYKAILINQLLGGEAIRLGHSFSYSLNKKRFIMMKNTSIPIIRKMKPLLILPVVALIFYAFAEPDYVYESNSVSNQEQTGPTQTQELNNGYETERNIPEKEEILHAKANYEYSSKENTPVPNKKPESKEDLFKLNPRNSNVHVKPSKKETIKRKVIQENGEVLPVTSIVIANSTTGAVADMNGEFNLKDVPENAEMVVAMKRDTVEKDINITVRSTNSHNENSKPLVFLDGEKIPMETIEEISPESIESIDVLKNKSAIEKYGEEGKHGVILITLKKSNSKTPGGKVEDISITGYDNDKKRPEQPTYNGKPIFFIVEEMPKFPGGKDALDNYISESTQYPAKAKEEEIEGSVFVSFIITDEGKITNTKVAKGVHPLLDEEAKRVIASMPDWEPGKQRGKNVVVQFTTPVLFEL